MLIFLNLSEEYKNSDSAFDDINEYQLNAQKISISIYLKKYNKKNSSYCIARLYKSKNSAKIFQSYTCNNYKLFS